MMMVMVVIVIAMQLETSEILEKPCGAFCPGVKVPVPGIKDYSDGDKSLLIMVRVKRVAQTYFIMRASWLCQSEIRTCQFLDDASFNDSGFQRMAGVISS